MAIKVIRDNSYHPDYEPDWNLEPLKYTGDTANDKIVANAGNNYIDGGAGNDRIDGGLGDDMLIGGLGKDILWGGKGSDAFVFGSALGGNNIDAIKDFSRAENDKIWLDDMVFKTLTPVIDPADQTPGDDVVPDIGGLDRNAFCLGRNAKDADDRVVYNKATGALYYDADGNGSGAAVKFAQLKAGTALSHWDFVVV